MNDWTETAVIDLADKRRELFNDGDWIESPFITTSGNRLLQTGNIGVGQLLDRGKKRYVSDESFYSLKCKEVIPGDILICRLADPAGRACIAQDIGEKRMLTSVDVTIYRPNSQKADRRFLVALFSTPQWFHEINERCGGSTRTRISRSELGKIRLLMPPVDEQRKIADALTSIDDLIAIIERLIAKKQAIKQGMMQQLLTGKSRLPGFHQEWIAGSLGKFMPLQRGFDLPTSQVRPGQYPVVYSNGIARFHDRALAGGPGVITGRSGTIGKVHYVDSDYWPHNTTLWVTNFKQTHPKFVFYFLTYVGLERFASGSGVPTLNRNDAHAMEIVIPSVIEEQEAIARVLTDADAEIDSLRTRLFKTKSIKQGMMQQLLTGRTRLPVEVS